MEVVIAQRPHRQRLVEQRDGVVLPLRKHTALARAPREEVATGTVVRGRSAELDPRVVPEDAPEPYIRGLNAPPRTEQNPPKPHQKK